MITPENNPGFLFLVDEVTVNHREHPILVLDTDEEYGRTFRVIPFCLWGVENNLSLGNTVFAKVANSVDKDGIFRGFKKKSRTRKPKNST